MKCTKKDCSINHVMSRGRPGHHNSFKTILARMLKPAAKAKAKQTAKAKAEPKASAEKRKGGGDDEAAPKAVAKKRSRKTK